VTDVKPLATLNAALYGNGPMSLELIQQSANELSLARMPYAEVRVQPQIVDALSGRIRAEVEGRTGEEGIIRRSKVVRDDPLVASGRGLLDAILPPGQLEARVIREPLCDLKTALLVATNVPEIPWELLHDGTDFLGLQYEMGRSLRARGPEWRPRGQNDAWQCLIIANPTGDLPTASSEATAVKENLEAKGIACDYLAEQDATFENVLECLSASHYDIIHYSGHIGRDEESQEYGLLLHGSQYFSSSAIKSHVRTPAIAFLNGCNSGEVVQGLTEAFLSTGAQMVIGSLYATPSRGAAAFAKKFYTEFLNGTSAGESMRQARLHVKGLENCGAAWACFVMYGDPRFSLELKVDELDAWLSDAGFERSDFDASAIKILQQALVYGTASQGVSTAIFFAALVEGAEPFLRQQLDRHGVLQLLEGAFKAALKDSEKSGEPTAGDATPPAKKSSVQIDISPHALGILRRAKEICAAQGLEKVTELGLVCGFAREAHGSAWTILRELKITPADLDPWLAAAAPATIGGVGSLKPAMCSERAWAILIDAAERALHDGAGGVSAIHLFQSMAADQASLLASAFRRLGIGLALRTGRPADASASLVFDDTSDPVLCSRNVNDILSRAQIEAEAEKRKIEELDLLRAFAKNGGGSAGSMMAQRGVPPRMLTTRLFLDGGVFDTGRFDESGQKVLDETFDIAKQRGYATIGSRHLLYGLLSASEYFAEELRRQDRDAEMLAEAFYAALPSGEQGSAAEILSWSGLSTSLLKMLLEAEALAESEGSDTISDKHLLRAWCSEGSGAARDFLIHQGVRVRKFCK
jgi:hypothetical protein